MASDTSGVRDLTEYSHMSVSSRPRLQIENVFLTKYDPIRLLTRLRVPSSSLDKRKKILVEDKFRGERRKNTIRKLSPHTSSRCLPTKMFPNYSKITLVLKRPVGGGRGASGMMGLGPQQNLSRWPSKNYKSRLRKVHKPKLKKKKRNNGEKKKDLSHPKYSKHVQRNRQLRVRFRSGKPNISLTRLRDSAALYLRRALKRLRTGKGGLSHELKLRRSRRRHLNKNDKHKGKRYEGSSIKVDDSRKNEKKGRRIGKFHFADINLPKPLPLPRVKANLPENQYLFHTIELLRHKRELQDRLQAMESDGVVYKLGTMPDRPEQSRNPYLTQNIPLKRRQVKEVISKRLLLNLAHSGFTHTKLRPLEVMADVVSNFLTQTSSRLKQVSELEMLDADHGFPDPMERVLNEVGIGGIRGLEEFYRTKVIDYGQRMEDQCSLLRRQYAYKVRSKVGLGNSTTTSATSSSIATIGATTVPTVNSTGGGSRLVANASKPASTSSSQPLSPGNSVLAEILSNQEEIQERTAVEPSPSVGMGEKHLEELMVAPPNVEIRPNSLHSQVAQHLPLRHLLTTLPQQSLQQSTTPTVHQLTVVTSAISTSPVSTVHQSYQPQQNQQLHGLQHQQIVPQLQIPHVNLNQVQHHTLQLSQGLHHHQPHLTQLLQRPITKSPAPTKLPHVVQDPPLSPYQVIAKGTMHRQNTASQINQSRNTSLNNNSRPVMTLPLQINLSKAQGQSTLASAEPIFTTVPLGQSALKTTTNKGKTVTIIKSSSVQPHASPGIILNERSANNNNTSTVDALPDFSSSQSSNNVISINLGGNDIDNCSIPQTVTMHAADSGIAAGGMGTGSSKARLKETINQRNLLRLNFEQVPSTAESTVLLSSSSAAAVANAGGNVQFVGKIASGQTISWNSNYP